MWTTKEVVIVSLATGLAFCFATIYSQRKIQMYIDNKVIEKSGNPLARLIPSETANVGQNMSLGTSVYSAPTVKPVQDVNHEAPPVETRRLHESPPGSGERWTPLEM